MVTGYDFAQQAKSTQYDGLSYEKADCQKFVETVLIDCGVRKEGGQPYDWKGSNSMWRNALAWKGTLEDCVYEYGEIPVGAWVFIVKHDGGEKERGYNDNEGNATHVGIYVGGKNIDHQVRDSTQTRSRDGVGYRKLDGFNMVGLPKMIAYTETLKPIAESISKQVALDALATLTKYVKGE